MSQKDDLERKSRLRAAILAAIVSGGALTAMQAQAHGFLCYPSPPRHSATAPAEVAPDQTPNEKT
jgi:hypothetical protein